MISDEKERWELQVPVPARVPVQVQAGAGRCKCKVGQVQVAAPINGCQWMPIDAGWINVKCQWNDTDINNDETEDASRSVWSPGVDDGLAFL